MDRHELIGLIKNKREFRNLDDAFVDSVLQPFVINKKIEELKKKSVEKILKEVRARLREVYGAFLSKDYFKKEKLLHEIKSLGDIEGHERILKLHISTRERLPYYRTAYEKILSIIGKPESILDLGCGLNPFSIPFMGFIPEYYAAELVKEDAHFIQAYFDRFKIRGKAFQVDLTEIKELPKADVCFLFKMLDTLETLKWDITAELLAKVKTKWVIVSFSTKSLGGRKVIKERKWFEKLIKNYSYEKFEIPNEAFYVIRHNR